MSNVLLSNAGRAFIASTVQQADLFLAWGSGLTAWDTTQTGTGTFGVDERISVGHPHLDQFVVTSGATTFVLDVDYSVDQPNGALIRIVTGTIAPAASVAFSYRIQPPPVLPTATGLTSEIGRHPIFNKQFVIPSSVGEIVVGGVAYSLSLTPTNFLMVEVAFPTDAESSAIIREAGVFLGGTVASGGSIPAGQLYFPLAQVLTPGILLLSENFENIQRTPLSREVFTYVLTF